MPWTLQWYIFREVGKTFLLTAIGLTAVIGMGGGVLNIIELQQVTPSLLLQIMATVVQVAVTLSLPVAALYSAAITYGRLSADNEFVACRSSGINVHILFAPTVVISLVSALITFVSLNYIIPDRIRNLDNLVRADLGRIVEHQLQEPGRLPLSKGFRMYADEVSRQARTEGDPTDTVKLLLRKAAFVMIEGDEWMRYGTADEVLLRFENLDAEPGVKAISQNVVLYDHRNKMETTERTLQLAQEALPLNVPLKVKWLNLTELLYYRTRTARLPELFQSLQELRALLGKEQYFRSLKDDFARLDATGQPDCKLTLQDQDVTIVLEATEMINDPKDFKPILREVKLTSTQDGHTIVAHAGGATMGMVDQPGPDFGKAYVQLYDNVTIHDPRQPGEPLLKTSEDFGPVSPPAELVARLGRITNDELVDPSVDLGEADSFVNKRATVIDKFGKVGRQVVATIHSRLAFSFCVVVLVIMAAALGIIFEGAHVLTAFGITMIPALLVIVTIIMGRQMAQNAETNLAGIGLIWSGIIVIGVANVFVLMTGVKR